MQITAKYGLTKNLTLPFDAGTSVGVILNDNRIKSALGLPESYTAYINGVEVSKDTRLTEDQTLQIEKAECTKGA